MLFDRPQAFSCDLSLTSCRCCAPASICPRVPFLLSQQRLDDECKQLLVDIRRIGSEPGSPKVTFGELFDDDDAQQYYEALVGTLKSAKKRGMIDFKGQMLLKGVHDNVVISIKDAKEDNGAPQQSQEPPKMVEEKDEEEKPEQQQQQDDDKDEEGAEE